MLKMNVEKLESFFGDRLMHNEMLARHTTSRVGGPASFFVVSNSIDQLAADVQFLWANDIPLLLLGSGSNMLVSDQGLDLVVVHNRAKEITIEQNGDQLMLRAGSGATLAAVTREAASRGYAGLEWASTIPGTLGGAVYGNAGAHGGETAKSLVMAEILHREKGRLSLTSEQMQYSYRSSFLKRQPGSSIILSAALAVHSADPAEITSIMQANAEKRRASQPAGPCFGSTFKNPVGDHAGRLIEASGLKGTKLGGVEVSPVHANFLINDGTASAEDYRRMISLIQNTVYEKFNVKLDLEIELLGKWQD